MEAICSSETSVDFQRSARLWVPEDIILHKYLFIIGFVARTRSSVITSSTKQMQSTDFKELCDINIFRENNDS
jgi:hypothetical protein